MVSSGNRNQIYGLNKRYFPLSSFRSLSPHFWDCNRNCNPSSDSRAPMALLFQKFQEAIKTLAKSPTFARDPRHLQFDADVNRLFLYTSYNRLGRNADEKDADEIIEMASKVSVADQQKQVQENIHFQIKNLCGSLDDILHPDFDNIPNTSSSVPQLQNGPRRSGLSFAIGSTMASTNHPVVPETRPLTPTELSQSLKDVIGYTLDIKPSKIPHEDAGLGVFLSGEADVGAVVAFYPGIIYSPASYRHIPGYPRVDTHNSYLITRYDGTVINAQSWGAGGKARELWDGSYHPEHDSNPSEGSDKIWKFLSKPCGNGNEQGADSVEVMELRNPLAFGHFANHPAKGMSPNVMVCPYDFPLSEKEMRVYVPNLVFGGRESGTMKRFGSFWFQSGGDGTDVLVMKTIVLVAMRALCDEEVLLNYRLSNSKRRPAWYVPVDEDEDRRRWS